VCVGQAVLAGWIDLATVDPVLAAQLADPSLATTLTRSSGKGDDVATSSLTGTRKHGRLRRSKLRDSISSLTGSAKTSGDGVRAESQRPRTRGTSADRAC
jgi:hypothetical protein